MHLNVRFVLFTIWFATLSQAENYYLFFVDRAECICFHTTNILLAIIIIIAISSIKHCRFAVSFSLWAVTYDIVKYFPQQKIGFFVAQNGFFVVVPLALSHARVWFMRIQIICDGWERSLSLPGEDAANFRCYIYFVYSFLFFLSLYLFKT